MRHRRRCTAALAGLLLLTGCPAGDGSADPAPRTSAAPSAAQSPSSAEPSAGPSADEDDPADALPLTTLRAVVDLTPAAPGPSAVVTGAAGSPDGGAYVVLSAPGRPHQRSLVTVAPVHGRFMPTHAVPLPHIGHVGDVHLLGDGTVLVSGQFAVPDPGYGYAVVVPTTGVARTVIVVPYEDGAEVEHGKSVVSPDGATLHLFLAGDRGRGDRLVAADVATGRLLALRELDEDVLFASTRPLDPWSARLLARPTGGVVLAFDARPTDRSRSRVPTLLSYDSALAPEGPPVRITRLAEAARLQAVAAGTDGTVYVSVATPERDQILAVPDGGGSATRMLDRARRGFDSALVVDPWRGWALLPTESGVEAVNLVTGRATPIDLDCAWPGPVRDVVPAATGAGAVLVGRCHGPAPGGPMLWLVGP